MIQVVNILEKIVWENAGLILKTKKGSCGCDKCKADIVAYALNNLQPRYVVTEKGAVISKAEYDMGIDIKSKVLVALTSALEVVSAYPRHDNM